MTITRGDIDKLAFRYEAHLNMGYEKDALGNYTDKHRGYGYAFRCVSDPRLSYIDRSTEAAPEHKAGTAPLGREWYVDGLLVPDLDVAVHVLAFDPPLMPDEQDAFDKVPDTFTHYDEVREAIAGEPRPDGAIMPNTPHNRALRLLDALKAKGKLTFQQRPSKPRGDGFDFLRTDLFVRQRNGNEPYIKD